MAIERPDATLAPGQNGLAQMMPPASRRQVRPKFSTYFDIISRTTIMRGGVAETYVLVGDALGRGMVQFLKQQK